MRENLKNKNIYNYFIDTTYKIIPKIRINYILMTVSCYNSETNISNLACLILYLFEDSKSFYYIFKYLYNYYKLFENVNEDNKNLLEHMFLTNNIEESLHSKINYYIPKKKINYNFFNGYY